MSRKTTLDEAYQTMSKNYFKLLDWNDWYKQQIKKYKAYEANLKQQNASCQRMIRNYKSEISNARQEITTYKSQKEKLESDIDRMRSDVDAFKLDAVRKSESIEELQEKHITIQKENESLKQKELNSLKQIEELKSALNENQKEWREYKSMESNGQLYVQNAILQYNETNKDLITPTDEVKVKQKIMNDIHNKNKTEIEKWNKFTKEIIDEFKQSQDNIDDAKNGIDASILLTSYSKCKSLWQQQKNRMESVCDFISEMAAQKYKAKNLMEGREMMVSHSTTIYNEESSKYNKMKETREKLQKELKHKLTELNEFCDKENISNEEKCKLLDALNTSKIEWEGYKSIFTNCIDLIKEYRHCDDMNDENIEKMQKYFENKWRECMEKWYDWNSESIICWIQYLTENDELILSDNINWDIILQQMRTDKVDGNSLLNIDKNDLKCIGFEILIDRQILFNKIQRLISTYPHPSTYNDEGKNNDNDSSKHKIEIPDEFICPLNKSIMKNPVQIFDGNTYEKAAIESYLEKYKKSPITHIKCDQYDRWFQPNRKLKQKIDAFLSIHHQYIYSFLSVHPQST